MSVVLDTRATLINYDHIYPVNLKDVDIGIRNTVKIY